MLMDPKNLAAGVKELRATANLLLAWADDLEKAGTSVPNPVQEASPPAGAAAPNPVPEASPPAAASAPKAPLNMDPNTAPT